MHDVSAISLSGNWLDNHLFSAASTDTQPATTSDCSQVYSPMNLTAVTGVAVALRYVLRWVVA